MAQITFNKSGELYKAQFIVNADFNLHVETTGIGRLVVSGSTVQNGEKQVFANESLSAPAFDHDYAARVYPKYMEVVSTVAVTSATVTEVK